jgi:hypothetical protein
LRTYFVKRRFDWLTIVKSKRTKRVIDTKRGLKAWNSNRSVMNKSMQSIKWPGIVNGAVNLWGKIVKSSIAMYAER